MHIDNTDYYSYSFSWCSSALTWIEHFHWHAIAHKCRTFLVFFLLKKKRKCCKCWCFTLLSSCKINVCPEPKRSSWKTKKAGSSMSSRSQQYDMITQVRHGHFKIWMSIQDRHGHVRSAWHLKICMTIQYLITQDRQDHKDLQDHSRPAWSFQLNMIIKY